MTRATFVIFLPKLSGFIDWCCYYAQVRYTGSWEPLVRYLMQSQIIWTHQIPTSCLPTLLIFIQIEHICSFFVAFFSANIDGRNLIVRHKLHIGTPFCGKRFFDPSDSYFLFADLVDFYTHLTYMHIFLSKYWWQKSDIWSQALYRYPISLEAFFDLSDSYFLFAKERGYHKWALAHSSSCWFLFF